MTMKSEKIIVIFCLLCLILIGKIHAFEFPINSLGNCRDTKECRLYCQVPDHKAACWSWSVYSVKNDVLGDQSPEEKLTPLGITFPIAELGNCTDISSCKNYCDIAQNQDACHQYAQNRGLTKKERVIEKAGAELGCSSLAECKTFCSQKANEDSCVAFANKYHLKLAIKNQLVEKAKNELGCNTLEQCTKMCADNLNRDKCLAFAQKIGSPQFKQREMLLEQAKTQLGCNSVDECRDFCQNTANQELCRKFNQSLTNQKQPILDNRLQNLKSTGDCATNQECKKRCQENPILCPDFPRISPDTTMSATNKSTSRPTIPNSLKNTGFDASGSDRVKFEVPLSTKTPTPITSSPMLNSEDLAPNPRWTD